MGTAVVTLPDGKRARITFDSPEQLDATVDDLVATHGKPQVPKGFDGDPVSRAFGETAVHMASGAAGAALGGVAGLARGAGAGAAALATGKGFKGARDAFAEEASDTVGKVGEALTYQPREKLGKAATGAIAKPFTWLAKKADVVGEKVADVTGSPALGAAANTALQSLPAVVAPLAGRGIRAVRGAASAGRATPAAEELSASGAPRSSPSDVGGGEVPRGTPPGGPQGTAAAPPSGAQPSAPPSPNTARAQAYASRIGLDWTRLGAGTRAALENIAKDASALDRLNPAAVKRQAHLESLRVPVPATRGQLTRDPAELRREAIVSRTDQGQPIRDVDIEANRNLQANLEILRGRVGGLKGGTHEPISEEGIPASTPSIREPTKLPTQVGEAGQGALREKAKWSKKGYNALFKIARETEPTAQAGVKPIEQLLETNPEIQHLGWVDSWLSKARKVQPRDAEGNPKPLESVTLNELHDLRSQASDIARTGGKEGHYAGLVVKAVDEAMKDVPAGAKAWKEAITAFRKHKEEFADQEMVRKLVSNKGKGADRQVALEKTWNTIAKGPLEQLKAVKKSMMTGGTPATRMAGRRAWRDIRAETVNRILEDARNVVATDETERQILTAAALQKSIKAIPRENLEEILGKKNVRELMDVLRATKIARTQPSARVTESGTVPNALLMAEKILGHIPGGRHVIGAARTIKELGEKGRTAQDVARATQTPLGEAQGQVAKSKGARVERRAQQYRDLEASGPTLPGATPQPSAPSIVPAAGPMAIGEALKQRKGPPP